MGPLVTLQSYPSRIEASVAKGLLETYGIQSIVFADDAGGNKPFPMSYSFGVELKVKQSDLQKAKKLLRLK
jgi:hypothetical protein